MHAAEEASWAPGCSKMCAQFATLCSVVLFCAGVEVVCSAVAVCLTA
jgi:hypothetical protein